MINLSHGVYHGTNISAVGIACHEAGHAVQYAQHYFPIKLRAAIIPITNLGSKLAMPLILLGVLLSALGAAFESLVYIGIACFSLSLVFQLITLPVEFNASRRAISAISDSELLTADEILGAKKTLRAAAISVERRRGNAKALDGRTGLRDRKMRNKRNKGSVKGTVFCYKIFT